MSMVPAELTASLGTDLPICIPVAGSIIILCKEGSSIYQTSVKPVDVDCMSLIEEVALMGGLRICFLVALQC